ncbi:MAG: hypothetical protein PHH59_08960 [Methylovulum sp.]|uniref:hypothetical protein n=1 Tax=Methylovulum sp. TaxID=1916980 RepID=UPI0026155C8D|nr:hypothetical protein [Methylovulum sp.]MDD2724132.1 hypothetical protein [Methylovulum sp.]MDD5124629.1 hypothetical protein [Methylovulum sp.]
MKVQVLFSVPRNKKAQKIRNPQAVWLSGFFIVQRKLNKDTDYRAAKLKDKYYTSSYGGGLTLLVKSNGVKPPLVSLVILAKS